jgi:hypothetical protein
MKCVCKRFQPLERNTLRGFCEISIPDWNLTIKDVAVHRKNDSMWASAPAKPLIKDGIVVKDESGKIAYFNIFEFADRAARDRFSDAVIAAVRATDDGRRALGAGISQPKPALDDFIPF